MIIDPAALVGQVLDGRYRLANFLGRGAVGWVYAAEELVGDTVIGTCALKLIRPGSADERASILREFTAAARLSHPLLVQFRGAFEVAGGLSAGCLCLALELAEGTLRGRLAGGRVLAPGEVSPLLRDLAEALAYLHGQGAVHRDVKPENLLRVGPHWKLGDFGLLRAVQGDLVTASGALGTPGYAAPESYQGRTGPGVDVWALGVLAHEALTGCNPFRGATPEALMAAVLSGEPDLAGLPPPFDAMVRGCLVKDLSRRWVAARVVEALSGASRPRVASPTAASVPRASAPPATSSSGAAPRRAVAATLPGLTPLGRNAQGLEEFRNQHDGSVLVLVPAGWFFMGSPRNEKGRFDDEARHEVVLSRGFLLASAPVTQGEYAAVTGSNPSRFRGADRPVENVSWFDVVRYCNAASRAVGVEEAYEVNGDPVRWKGPACPGYRLPTEAEWEYACRAGSTGARYGDLDAIAWHSGNSGSQTQPVRRKRPSAWGFYDVLGNVWEWCWDWYGAYPGGRVTDPTGPGGGFSRVRRGGSWLNDAQYARAALRGDHAPADRYDALGFRLARSLPEAAGRAPGS